MKYTVKQLAAMSGVSVRTLHFYDQTGLLKPAFYGKNGYRFYQEPELLALQQILFYRTLGFQLKQIQQVIGRADFEKLAALQSHRKILQEDLARTLSLIETIDKTLKHLEGTEKMKSEEMFVGFSVGAGRDRFDEQIKLGGEPSDCKVSAQDTNGAMCIFEFTGTGCGPRHAHREQDEWIYILEGEFDVHVGANQFRAGPGQSIFIPLEVPHVWSSTGQAGKIINTYQPAGNMEAFFRELGQYDGKPPIHEVLSFKQFVQFFHDHGIDLKGPPLTGEWKVNEEDRIIQIS